MYVATDSEGNYIDIDDVIFHTENKYYCPQCKGELRIKNGNINKRHFSHVSLEDCDSFSSDMSEWHREWQKEFPVENREVVIQHTFPPNCYPWDDDYEKTVMHRADICINNYVIELQHSPISQNEFDERNWFYTTCGYKVIWIFDFREEYENRKISFYDEWHRKIGNGAKFSWKYPHKFMMNWNPKEDEDIIILFQLSDRCKETDDDEYCYFERVIWVIDENGHSNFKKFFTSYTPGDIGELKQFIDKNIL